MESTSLVLVVCIFQGIATRANVYDGAKVTLLREATNDSGNVLVLKAGYNNDEEIIDGNNLKEELDEETLIQDSQLFNDEDEYGTRADASPESKAQHKPGEQSITDFLSLSADKVAKQLKSSNEGDNEYSVTVNPIISSEGKDNITGGKGINLSGGNGKNLTGENSDNLSREKGENLSGEEDKNLTEQKDISAPVVTEDNKILPAKGIPFGDLEPGDLADLFGPNQHYSYPSTYSDFGRRYVANEEDLERAAEEDLDNHLKSYAMPDNDIIPVKDYWNDVWTENINPDALRSTKKRSSKKNNQLNVVRASIMPGTSLHKLISTLKNVSPRLLYVINKDDYYN